MSADTTQGRVPMLSLEEAERVAAEIGLPDALAPLSVFRVLLNHPVLAKAVSDLLIPLLMDFTLDARLRELIIMRIGWVTGSVYEWTQHWRVARGIQMTEDDVLGVRDWQNHAPYGPTERAVLQATDETLEVGVISPETWAACKEQLQDDRAMIQLVLAINNWRLFSSLLRSLDIPLEADLTPWPPDGKVPGA